VSEPKRYKVGKLGTTETIDCVSYEDYARLKAEVERLTKAGDVMLSEWASGDEKDAKNFLKALVIWNAAKEGK
jgi:hypothetical protein